VKNPDAQKIVDALDREIRLRGRGAISAVNRHFGHERGWWHQRADAGSLGVGEMAAILDFLGMDPLRFVREVFADESNAPAALGLSSPRTRPPDLVLKAQARFQEDGTGGILDESFLETLDSIRYTEPHSALDKAVWGADHVKGDLIPKFLGILAAIFRHLVRLDDAEHALFAAISMAGSQEDHPTTAVLIQRLAYVVAERTELNTALMISEKAMSAFLRCGDAAGAARAIVDQGLWLSRLGRSEEMIRVGSIALQWLPKDDSRNRCAIHQTMALNYRALGRLQEAVHYLDLAEDLADTNASLAQDKILWLRGLLQADFGNLQEAEEILVDVFDRFCEYKNGEEALLICDVVKVQLLRNKGEDAYQTAASMMKLLEPLRNDKVVSAAIAELLRSGQDGLTLALVERIRAKIEGELRASMSRQQPNR